MNSQKATKFEAKITRQGSRGMRGLIVGEIMQGDVQIGTFRRGAISSGFVPPIEARFFTVAARARFEDFADSLSIGETIEALAF